MDLLFIAKEIIAGIFLLWLAVIMIMTLIGITRAVIYFALGD